MIISPDSMIFETKKFGLFVWQNDIKIEKKLSIWGEIFKSCPKLVKIIEAYLFLIKTEKNMNYTP